MRTDGQTDKTKLIAPLAILRRRLKAIDTIDPGYYKTVTKRPIALVI
jgi:hypothetical protein